MNAIVVGNKHYANINEIEYNLSRVGRINSIALTGESPFSRVIRRWAERNAIPISTFHQEESIEDIIKEFNADTCIVFFYGNGMLPEKTAGICFAARLTVIGYGVPKLQFGVTSVQPIQNNKENSPEDTQKTTE